MEGIDSVSFPSGEVTPDRENAGRSEGFMPIAFFVDQAMEALRAEQHPRDRMAVRPIHPITEVLLTDDELLAIEKVTITADVLLSAVSALFSTHQNPGAVRAAFSRVSELDVANQLPNPWSPAALEVAELLRTELLSLLQAREALRTLPQPSGTPGA